MRRPFRSVALCALCLGLSRRAESQQPAALTRAQATAAALAHSPRLTAARADSAAAAARITTAGAIPDPTLSLSYSKSEPQYHVSAELPIDQLWLRGIRVRAAEASALAARYRLHFEIASLTLDVDTLYTRALAAAAHVRLSTRNAGDADSLRRMVVARRDAGDASDMDVELATLTAGQQANIATADSVTERATILELQALLGLTGDSASVRPVDSLVVPETIGALPAALPPTASPLQVASSRAELEAATLTARVQRRSILGSPGITFGFETGEPSGAEPGLLPTFGVAVPLPIFNRNRGPIAEADAARARANAELAIARQESALQLGRTRAALVAAASRLARDRQLLQSADRVIAMALAAYREGASPLASVLEAQRSAREVRTGYIDDVANALVAAATLRLLSLTPDSAVP
ncbi:MAG: TolC family protein [Gemmatimonadales bacterium]